MEAFLAALLAELPSLVSALPALAADVEALVALFQKAKTPAQQVHALSSLAALAAKAHAA